MNRIDDYRDRMVFAKFNDADIDRLLSRGRATSPALRELVPFIEMLRSEATSKPSPSRIEQMSIQAAAVARASALPLAPGLDGRSRARVSETVGWRRHLAAVAASLAVIVGLSGVGLAADASVPGDALYGLDRAMERIGLGNGAMGERLMEARVLLDREQVDTALGVLFTSASDAVEDSGGLGDALSEFAAGVDAAMVSGDLAGAKGQVAELLDFIDANVGKGVGVDGKDFGQGVAEIARGWAKDDATGTDGISPVGEEDGDEGPGDATTPTTLPAGTENGNSNAGGNGNSNAGGNGNGNAGGNGNANGNGGGNSNAGGNGNGSNGKP